MKKRDLIGLAAFFVLLTACISTTTGSISEPSRNEKDAAELNYELGARYYNQGTYILARDRLMLASEIDPTMAIAFSTLALTYEALDNPRLAREAYENAVRAEPKNFDVQNAYAVYLCRNKDYSGALKFFDKAIAHRENDSRQITMTNAGMCMLEKPDNDAAEGYYRDALAFKPRHGDALIQLCLLKYQQKDYLGARAFLQRFMASNVSTAGVLYLASRIEDMLGNDSGRTDYEDQLLREFPASSEARKVLGSG